MELSKTQHQEWIKKRSNAVRHAYTAFDCLIEHNYREMLVDDSTAIQVPCPFHGPDNNPSARYYPGSGKHHDYMRCFKCRENWDSINLFSKFKGLKFMESLVQLERRFKIKIPPRPEAPEIVDPVDRKPDYISDQWNDVPRVLALMEKKLLKIRDKCSMIDYVKFCRLMDAVAWDFDKSQKVTPDMVQGLKKCMERMDEASTLSEFNSYDSTY